MSDRYNAALNWFKTVRYVMKSSFYCLARTAQRENEHAKRRKQQNIS